MIKDKEISEYIIFKIKGKLEQFGIDKSEIKNDFDLVQSGLLDSMSFVDLVTEMEKYFTIEIDFEEAFDESKLTKINGLIEIFKNAPNE
ncbi:MAG: acyl carrier protein [Bacteroidales bacterium]|nr:acyl carrier protein [Bacteroidales bacterium]